MPKPLIEVAGLPLIAYPLRLLRAAGIRDVVINLHHLGDRSATRSATAAAYGVSITYSEEEPILDTGGADQAARIASSAAILRRAQRRHGHRPRPRRASSAGIAAGARWRRWCCGPTGRRRATGVIEIDAQRRIRRFLGRPRRGARAARRADVRRRARLRAAGVLLSWSRAASASRARPIRPCSPQAARCSATRSDGYWRVLDTHAGLAEGRWELARGAGMLTPARRSLTNCVMASTV